MIEAVKTFFGRLRGRGQTIVEYGLVWRCTKCHLIFITKKAGEQHPCQDQKVN
jgi:hypothetical protein